MLDSPLDPTATLKVATSPSWLNQSLLTSSEEGEYHVIDWRSFKTPRVARSSLGAEAQAGGQAADSVDFTCRFWQHLLPSLRLQDLIEAKSTLKSVLVTDAKALHDSYQEKESAPRSSTRG